ncbi:MAG: sigma-70 family RNA polymerase sigma factor [Rhodanobacter sp.]
MVIQDVRPRASAAFPETSWGLVLATRDDAGNGRDAFADLCRRYWMPVYAMVRRHGLAPADAEDLVQGFFLHLIEHGTVGRADPALGRFRSFLLGALRWFLANEYERDTALKRGGHSTFVPIDRAEVESSLQFNAESEESLDLQFDRQWARALVRNALDALRAEYAKSAQAQLYATLQSCLDPAVVTPSYADLATRLACNEGAVKVAVHRLRGRFRAVLRREVALTVATAQEVDEELAYLRDVLAASLLPASAS